MPRRAWERSEGGSPSLHRFLGSFTWESPETRPRVSTDMRASRVGVGEPTLSEQMFRELSVTPRRLSRPARETVPSPPMRTRTRTGARCCGASGRRTPGASSSAPQQRLWSDQGYEATTVEQICAAAGVGRTTYYLHFETKEQLLSELSWATASGVAADVDAAVAGGNVDEQLEAFVDGLTRRMESVPLSLAAFVLRHVRPGRSAGAHPRGRGAVRGHLQRHRARRPGTRRDRRHRRHRRDRCDPRRPDHGGPAALGQRPQR